MRRPGSAARGTTAPSPSGPESFDAFFHRELPALVAFAGALAGPQHAEDVAQDAMIAAYRRWDEVARMDVPQAWVRRVCANIAVSSIRRRASETRALLRLGTRPDPAPVLVPEEALSFWARVRTLPRRQAQVVALHYVYDLGVAEIAATLDLAEGTVKAHLFRGRETLARSLGQDLEVGR